MAVQRKEFVAIVCFVPKDYQRAVIKLCRVFREQVHRTIERSANGGARHDKHVEPQVDRSPLGSMCLISSVLRRGVKHPCFVIPPDSDGCVLTFHSLKNGSRKLMDFGIAWIGAEHTASHAQVKNVERSRP